MPDDSEGDEQSSSRVEKMINALDELQDAVDRLAAETRAAGRRATQDREEPGTPKYPRSV